MKKLTTSEGLVLLLLNILIIPGLGTLIFSFTKLSHRRTEGIIIFSLALVSIPLFIVLIGFLLFPIMWIISLVNSIIIMTKDVEK